MWWRRKGRKTTAEGADKDGGAPRGGANGDIPPPVLMVLKAVQEMDRKPPVTLALIALMFLLHVQATRAPALFLPFSLCPDKVVANFEFSRVLVSPFLHFDDWYLYQSILSFLWKGYHLEGRLGSVRFSLLLLYLIVLSQALIVIGAHLLSSFFLTRGAVHECFMGFSGVLSSLKMLLNYNSPTFTQVYNFKVPTKYAAWLELVVTYLLVPKLPLLAQVGGLLAGYIYVVTPSAQTSIDKAARLVQRLLIHAGIVKRPFQWRRLWPNLASFMKTRKQRWRAQKY